MTNNPYQSPTDSKLSSSLGIADASHWRLSKRLNAIAILITACAFVLAFGMVYYEYTQRKPIPDFFVSTLLVLAILSAASLLIALLMNLKYRRWLALAVSLVGFFATCYVAWFIIAANVHWNESP